MIFGVPRPVDIVIDFLTAQDARGFSHITLDDQARAFLNHLVKWRSGPPKSVAPKPAPVAENTAAPIAAKPTAAQIVMEPLIATGSTKFERLADLKRRCESLVQRSGITTLRDKCVFSSGSPDAAIAFIGDCPTHHDEQSGQPFSGMVGEKFDAILKAMGLTRSEVYLTQLVKYRPAMLRQTTNNRTPNPAEIAAFLPVLALEMQIVQPRLIVALGSVPSIAICASEEPQPLEKLRGNWHEWHGVPVRPSETPAFLLTASNNKKREFWEDLLAAMEKLEMPISEKQRSYFQGK